jgi:Na+/H+ antiporter NhaD/arsenite permease-like protein
VRRFIVAFDREQVLKATINRRTPNGPGRIGKDEDEQADRAYSWVAGEARAPSTVHRLPTTIYPPTTVYRLPTTLSITAHRSPLTDYRSPITAHRLPITAYRFRRCLCFSLGPTLRWASSYKEQSAVDLAWLSLAALIVVIVVSCTTTLNAGLLAIVLAWVLGVYIAPLTGKAIGLKAVMTGFPADLFLTLVGVTLLFTIAQTNGTLDRVARRAVASCRGNSGLIPIMFFLLTLCLAAIGPGNIAAAALVAPMAMAVAARAGISAFLMTLMVAHGAVAGALSPLAPTGIIARDRMRDIGLEGFEGQTFLYNLMANGVVAFIGYFACGGVRLLGKRYSETISSDNCNEQTNPPAHAAPTRDAQNDDTFRPQHSVTLVTVAVVVMVVLFSKIALGREVHVGMTALVAALILILLGHGDERAAMRTMPWSVILMVCGVTVLTSLLQQTGGIERMTELVAKVSDRHSVTGVIALIAGLVSVYSSTSGVVLPAFLPMTPGLVEQVGGNALAIASSINVGGHLVDVSPLSTIGALCVASASASEDRRKLFNKVLAWGLSMSLVGAALCYSFLGSS